MSIKTKRIGYICKQELTVAADLLPSNLNRSTLVHSLISAYGLDNCTVKIDPVKASVNDLMEFHSREFIDFLMNAEHMAPDSTDYELKCKEFGLEDDCPVFPGLSDYVSWIAGGALSAADTLCNKQCDVCLFWDGGRHHGQRDKAEGFCYINDIVLAIFRLHSTFEKVLYIDIDIHHGDGVESAFAFSPRVMTVSFHRFDQGFYPGTGTLGDVGYGRGLYHSLNLPLRSGLNGSNFLKIFKHIIHQSIVNYSPNAIVMQVGADGLAGDPLGGNWNLDIKSVGDAVKFVLDFNIPTLLFGGGGYKPALAARCWTFCTSVALGLDSILPTDIPEHDYFTEYGPDFTIWNESRLIQDKNEDGFVDKVLQEADLTLQQLSLLHSPNAPT